VLELENGYEIIENFLTFDQLNFIKKEIDTVRFPAKSGGIRNAEKKYHSIQKLAVSKHVVGQARKYLAGTPCLVRAILFNKTAENNWLVTWHQDKTVAVSQKFEKFGWGPWSVKDGVVHTQPPLDVLNQMVTFRIHLDDTNQENGCLKVLPKSNDLGVLNNSAIQKYVQNHTPVLCIAKAGSVLAMRPHILHSSSKASCPTQRRVLHLEYCSFNLPSGVAWA